MKRMYAPLFIPNAHVRISQKRPSSNHLNIVRRTLVSAGDNRR